MPVFFNPHFKYTKNNIFNEIEATRPEDRQDNTTNTTDYAQDEDEQQNRNQQDTPANAPEDYTVPDEGEDQTPEEADQNAPEEGTEATGGQEDPVANEEYDTGGEGEEGGDEGGDAQLLDLVVLEVEGEVAQHRAALAHQGHAHQRVEEVAPGIGEQLRLDGAEDVVQAGDDDDLLHPRKDHVAEDAEVLGHPDQAVGDAVGQQPADRAHHRKEQDG